MADTRTSLLSRIQHADDARVRANARAVGGAARPNAGAAARLGVAALNALPWILGFILATILIVRMT